MKWVYPSNPHPRFYGTLILMGKLITYLCIKLGLAFLLFPITRLFTRNTGEISTLQKKMPMVASVKYAIKNKTFCGHKGVLISLFHALSG